MHMQKENDSKKTDGFSIVEMLMAVAIGLIVLAGLVVTFVSQKKAYDVQAQVAEMHQGARAALDMISRDVAGAGYDPTNYGLEAVPVAQAHKVQLRADLNGDGDTDDDFEDVTYELAGTVINRTSGGSTVAFAENVAALNFLYYDADGNTTTDPDEILKIVITLTTRTSRPDPSFDANGGYRTRTLSSEVILRNMVENIAALPTVAPVTTIPVTTSTEPSVTEPSVTEPSVTEPSVTEPSVTEPSVTEPTVTETPTTLPPGGFEVTILVYPNNKGAEITAEVQSSVLIGSAKLFYQVNNTGEWNVVVMSYVSFDKIDTYTYSVTISFPKGARIDYYVEAYDADEEFMGRSADKYFIAE